MKEIGEAYEKLFECFESVCFKRLDRGATEEQVILYLKHLKNDVWNKNKRVCNYLQGMIEGFEADINFNKPSNKRSDFLTNLHGDGLPKI